MILMIFSQVTDSQIYDKDKCDQVKVIMSE